jgi:crotonobetainyl-CoA:carnitine CoA-transferase CaiB-like acyl-CoA transferase
VYHHWPGKTLTEAEVGGTGLPFRFGDEPSPSLGKAPALGEHTVGVLTTVLGLSHHEIGRLRDDGLLTAAGLHGPTP